MWFSDEDRIIWQPPAIVGGLTVLILIIGSIAGCRLFTVDTMYRQLGEVETIQFNDMIKQIDVSQIPIVDLRLAQKQADKKIGEDPALGSRAKLGNGALQNVNGDLIYVFPIEHSSFWTWKKFQTTPGYITVSACNPNDVQYVTSINGEDIENRYLSSSSFSYNLKRHIRNEGYFDVGLTDYTYELDDTGRPYYVVTTYENVTVWDEPEATGVVVDVQTGETAHYTDPPEWIDIVHPESFIENQIDNWGKFVHGLFNWSNKDKIQRTDRTSTVYVDGDCYYFTGMTSVGSDQSCIGFIMVNTSNKHAMISYMSGATEDAAMSSAEGLVSDFGYKATEPLPINVNGIPTYVMALKDNEELIKAYAMVNIENYSIAVKGSTLYETSRAYMQAMVANGNQLVASNEAFQYTYEGAVKRISTVIDNGFTSYYMMLEGKDNIFTASSSLSYELPLTQVGDIVTVSYIDDKNGTIDISAFDNKNISGSTSDDETTAIDSDINNITNVDSNALQKTWEQMTEEERAKMIEDYNNK